MHSSTDLPFTGERYVPSVHGYVELEHRHRYHIASRLATGKRVLDIACGEGYGSAILAQSAAHVVGVDVEESVVAHANAKYASEKTTFLVGKCEDIPVPDHTIDLVVSFETLEHTRNQDQMLSEIHRVLEPDGVLILSSPNRSYFLNAHAPPNPFHLKELSLFELDTLLKRNFKFVRLLGQRVAYGSVIAPLQEKTSQIELYDLDGRPIFEADSMEHWWIYFIVIASDSPLPESVSGMLGSALREEYFDGLVSQLRGEAAEHNSAMKSIQEQLALSQTSERKLALELETEGRRFAAIESQLKASEKLSNDRDSAIKSLEGLLDLSKSNEKRLADELEPLRTQIVALGSQLTAAQTLSSERHSVIKSLEALLAVSRSNEEKRGAENVAQNARLADLAGQLAKSNSNEQRSAAELEAVRSQIVELRHQLAAAQTLSSNRDMHIKSLESFLALFKSNEVRQKAEIEVVNSRLADIAGQLAVSKMKEELYATELTKINRRWTEKLRRRIRAFRKQTRPLRYFLMGKQVLADGARDSWYTPADSRKTEVRSVVGFIKSIRRKTRPVRYFLMGKQIKSENTRTNATATTYGLVGNLREEADNTRVEATAPPCKIENSMVTQKAPELLNPAEPSTLINQRRVALARDVERRIQEARKPAPISTTTVAGPTVSIVMPVYNTPPALLDLTILSVRAQTYPNWELCICDDGSSSGDVADTARRHAKEDDRIKFSRQEVNKGISAASNAALALSNGEFIGLLDHDDVLLPDALAQFAAAISECPDADMLYSDEAIINEDGSVQRVFIKPDWSPALLTSVMYTGHFSVYRKSLLESVGAFRSRFDFSQDYDLAFRASEVAHRIVHVPHIAYAWRAINGSAAAGGKPFARATNIAALTDALQRRSLPAHGDALPYSNRVFFDRKSLTDLLSIIIPSDNDQMIIETLNLIRSLSTYQNYEILVVTKSAIAGRVQSRGGGPNIRYVKYDKPFNFSDKCNAGAAHARGNVLVFFNDDVRVITPDWIETLLECLHLGGVGAAGPKMIYDNGLIQHAGMVAGVRRLVGTAFHCLPGDSGEYFNMAQSTREVSLLSGACLAVPADVFREVGGFDAINTPVAHSDVDLCLRIRARGLRCVYTPHATLRHTGHVSIGSAEKTAYKKHVCDKADIFLLRRWCREISYDPFFTKHMRDLVYHDSPEDYQIHAPLIAADPGGMDILLIAHDLSRSGAPRALVDMARTLKEAGNFVVVTSPTDGPHRDTLLGMGVPVITDAHVLTGHDTVVDFGKNFDIVIGNTVLSWRDIQRLSQYTRTYLYSLESNLIPQQFLPLPGFTDAIRGATGVWSVTERTARHLRASRDHIDILPNPAAVTGPIKGDRPPGCGEQVRIVLIGSLESRKGQDIAVEAIMRMSEQHRRQTTLTMFGRRHDPDFVADLMQKIEGVSGIELGPELAPSDCLKEIRQADIVLLASRDDTLPLISLDCLALGRVLVCTRETGTSEFLEDGISGFIAENASSAAIADALTRALAQRKHWAEIGRRGREICERNFTYEIFQKRLLGFIGCPGAPSSLQTGEAKRGRS